MLILQSQSYRNLDCLRPFEHVPHIHIRAENSTQYQRMRHKNLYPSAQRERMEKCYRLKGQDVFSSLAYHLGSSKVALPFLTGHKSGDMKKNPNLQNDMM